MSIKMFTVIFLLAAFLPLRMFLLLLLLLVPLGIFFYNKRKRRNEEFWKPLMEIPGPKAYPIIGTENVLNLTSESMFAREIERSKEFYPIFKAWTLNIATVVLLKPEDVELLLKNTVHNEKGILYNFLKNWLGTGLLISRGEKWHYRRKILTPAFHFNILQEFIELIYKESELLIDNLKQLSKEPYVNVVKPITNFTLFSIGETALGVSFREDPKGDEYIKAIDDYGTNFGYLIARPWLFIPLVYKFSSVSKKFNEVVKVLHDFSENVISRKANIVDEKEISTIGGKRRLALLDLLLKAQKDGAKIDNAGLREELDTFIFAGTDTTATALSFHLMLLANNPDVQEQLYEEIISVIGRTEVPDNTSLAELKYMERCIKEAMRLYPPAAIISRVAGEDMKLKSGYTIPKGCDVNVFIYYIHRAPEIWDNPEKFDPDRFLPENSVGRHPFAFIPFSAGSRNCIGQKYAMLEMKIALVGIMRNFKLEPFDRPEHLKLKNEVVMKSADDIRVTLVPRR